MVLSEEALADLRYIEPKRAADRVISCLNELYRLFYFHTAPTPDA